LPHVHPSRPPGATASRGGRSPVLPEREASSTQVPEEEGVELRRTADGKGDGVMATRPFAAGETVMVGFLVGALTSNDSHATQVGPGRWARHGGLGPMVYHSCDPNCGVRLNDGQAFDFVARQPIGAGRSLTFDYAMRNFTIDHFPAGYEPPRRAPDLRDRLADLSGGGGSIGGRPRPTEHGARQSMRLVCRWSEQVLQAGVARPVARRSVRLKRRFASGSLPVGRSSAWPDGGCPQG
jgi:SET domain-containing protein